MFAQPVCTSFRTTRESRVTSLGQGSRRSRSQLRKVLAHVVVALATFLPQARAQGLASFNVTRPMRICTASIQNFGLNCNGAPAPELEHAIHPLGPVPVNGWCEPGQDFCGHDVDVWSEVAGRLGLVEHRDYERVCLGELGFSYLIESLAGLNSTYGVCDIGVSSVTVSSEREDMGIKFSRATHRSSLAIMVHAPLKERGNWTFFDPLHWKAWIALLATVAMTPMVVFFIEAVFNKCTYYAEDGKLDVFTGLRECMWHSLSHTLSIDVFRVSSFSARIIVAAYAFLVLIFTHTYTANLAAFLTVRVLDTSIRTIADLRGKAVATAPPYVNRLQENHHITASASDGWDDEKVVARLLAGEYAAYITDDTALVPRAYADDSCSLHILDQEVERYDFALAFRRGFPSDDLRTAVSGVLLDMQEDGTLEDIKEMYTPPKPKCLVEAKEFEETNQVELGSLMGLWIIMAGAAVAAVVGGVGEYAWKRYRKHEDVEGMRHRLKAIASSISRHDRRRAHAAEAAVAAVAREEEEGVAAVGHSNLPLAPHPWYSQHGRPAPLPLHQPHALYDHADLEAEHAAAMHVRGGTTAVPQDPNHRYPAPFHPAGPYVSCPCWNPHCCGPPRRPWSLHQGAIVQLPRGSGSGMQNSPASQGNGVASRPSRSEHSTDSGSRAEPLAIEFTSASGASSTLSPDAHTLMLPGCPQAELGGRRHAQQGESAGRASAEAPDPGAKAPEWQVDMAEAIWTLQTAAQRVAELQRLCQTHV